MPKPLVTLSCINGLEVKRCISEIFPSLRAEFDLVESKHPAVCITGPYGAARPPEGALHVAYLCENIWPEPEGYDWCFGTWREDAVRHPRYTMITWHGFDPHTLIKTPGQVRRWQESPRRFCNFFYSNPVPLRESFCRELARYQTVDCPGHSLRNQPPIDEANDEDRWTRKRQYLSAYRFTVAFENSVAPGYHTEKIIDPMVAGSIPVYWGDPHIAEYFNPRSFLHARDFISPPSQFLDRCLRRLGRRTHRDYRPALFHRPADRVNRRLHHYASRYADRLWRLRGWEPLVNAVRTLNEDPERYAAMLSEPWLTGNRVPDSDTMIDQWRRLFRARAVAP